MGTMAADPFKICPGTVGKTGAPFFMRSSPAGRAMYPGAQG
jgi:hypothetical protein